MNKDSIKERDKFCLKYLNLCNRVIKSVLTMYSEIFNSRAKVGSNIVIFRRLIYIFIFLTVI